MGITDTNQLPSDLQSSLSSFRTPGAPVVTPQAALSGPDQGAPASALSPADAVAPPSGPMQQPWSQALAGAPKNSFGAKFGAALEKTPLTLQPDGKPEPGAWSRSLIGAAQSVLSGMGDAAAATKDLPSGGGWLTGMANTQAARGQRLLQQKQDQEKQAQQKIENDRANRQEGRLDEDAQTRKTESEARMVTANMQMKHEQGIIYAAGRKAVEDSVDRGTKTLDFLRNQKAPVIDGPKGISYAEGQQQLIDKKLNIHEWTPYPSGIRDGEDKNGNSTTTTLYDWVKPGGPVTLNKDQANLIKTLPDYKDQKLEGTSMDFDKFNSLNQRVQNQIAQQTVSDNAKGAAGVAASKADVAALAQDDEWRNALASTKNNDVHKALDAVNQMDARKKAADPNWVNPHPNLSETVKNTHGGEAQWEKETKDRAEEAQKAIDEADKKKKDDEDESNPEGVIMTPEMAAQIGALPKPQQDLLSHYPSNRQAQLYAVAFGHDDGYRLFRQSITKGGSGIDAATAFGIAHQLNPAFDPSKAKTYQDTRKTFSAGPVADNINNMNAAFGHLADLQKATGVMSTIPGLRNISAFTGGQRKDYETALTNATSEVAGAYAKSGKPTEQDLKERGDDLRGSTPWESQRAVHATAEQLISKVNALQHQWDEGSVPGTTPPINLLGPEAIAAIKQIDPSLLNKIEKPTNPQLQAPSDRQAAARAQVQVPAGNVSVKMADGRSGHIRPDQLQKFLAENPGSAQVK